MNTTCGRTSGIALAALGAIALATPGVRAGGWVEFQNETSTRLIGGTGEFDTDEKDYAWGDVDLDGDIDLVVVRKQPFTSAGRRKNVLFMNEGVADGQAVNGVLVDRTNEYAIASDDGSQGFRDDTNDRDVQLVDVNGDGWLDVVTATTISDGLPKTISHPRIYINLKELAGEWLGFEYQEARTPQIFTIPAGDAVAPRFCSLAVGDVTGDGAPDLYFGDYDSSGAGGVPPPPGVDVNDRLWVNDGNGFFTDSLQTRMTAEMLLSAFGTAAAIEDMNDDGVLDVVKDTGLQNPTRISVSYNDPADEGHFNDFDIVYTLSPYFISVGDLNNDGRLDIVAVDDGTDRYLLNTGNGGDGLANFSQSTFPSGSNGFGGNSVIADLNNDGHNDVVITDVDVDIEGCSRRMHIWRNLGNVPNVSFQEQGEVIPNAMLSGTHDVAVFDINNDGWLDMVVGRCTGTQVWMNVPPFGLTFTYPEGLPAFVPPDQPYTIKVIPTAIGGVYETGSARLHVSVDGGPFVASDLVVDQGEVLQGTLPGTECTKRIAFYVSGNLESGGTFTDPPSAPASSYVAIAADGTEISFRDEMEDDVSAWIVTSSNLTSGEWEQADPNGTISGGALASPEDDATAGENFLAFITENGAPGDPAGAADLDGGPTNLVSPRIDLDGTDATISFARWFFCDDEGTADEDTLRVEVSNNDGGTWTSVAPLTTTGTGSAWEDVSFVVGDYVVPTADVRVRFSADDQPNNSITEAGIDNFQVEEFMCDAGGCVGDIDGNGSLGFQDLLSVLSNWGPCGGCPQDIDGSGSVGFNDVLFILSNWGGCPQ